MEAVLVAHTDLRSIWQIPRAFQLVSVLRLAVILARRFSTAEGPVKRGSGDLNEALDSCFRRNDDPMVPVLDSSIRALRRQIEYGQRPRRLVEYSGAVFSPYVWRQEHHVVGLTERDAELAQDGVCGGDMEIQV
jgi:hypothetical protein